jgi:hypothetical protein
MKATITSIEEKGGIVTVNLEWNGADHTISDFETERLGDVCHGIGNPMGGNLRSGWVVLEGECELEVGDTIPLAEVPPEFITIYAGDHVSRKEAEHQTLEEAQAWCAEQGCESDWVGQDSRTPRVKGYDLKEIYHEGENCIWCWIFERE